MPNEMTEGGTLSKHDSGYPHPLADHISMDRSSTAIQTAAWEALPYSLPESSSRSDFNLERLDKAPSMSAMYFKALRNRPQLKRGESVPALQVESPFKLTEPWLKDYLSICGWKTEETRTATPMTAPQTFAAPLHMYLLTHSSFPASTLGLVHAANQMLSQHPISSSDELMIRSWTGETRWKSRGFEIDLHTSIFANGEQRPSWLGKTTIFRSVKTPPTDQQGEKKEEVILEGSRSPLELSSDLGRRYAPVAGDYNPIHLYPITAKLFGFKRPIIHGMWTVAHLLSKACPQATEAQEGQMSVQFKRPLSLPLSSFELSEKYEDTHLMQAFDHREKLAVDLAFIAHTPMPTSV